MMILLTKDGTNVTLDNERIIITLHNQCIGEVLLKDLDCIMSFGGINFSTPLIKKLLKKKISLFFFSKYGSYTGKLSPPTIKNGLLRLKQYETYITEQKRIEFAKSFVFGKTKNSLYLLKERQKYHKSKKINAYLSEIEFYIKTIQKVDSIDKLRGIEGTISRLYFKSLGHLINAKEFKLKTRTKHPPKDKINSLLSLGYSILSSRIHGIIESAGLDPCIGFLHSSDNERPSLVFDLMEEWRFLIDSFTIKLVNLKIIKPDYFKKDNNAIYLTEYGLKIYCEQIIKLFNKSIFYHRLNKKMNIFNTIKEQIYLFSRSINSKRTKYRPFLKNEK